MTTKEKEEDLDLILPDRNIKSIIDWNNQYESYWKFETSVRLYLKVKGWTYIEFFSLDSDRFGPLVRGMRATDPDNQKRLFSYG